MEDMREWKEMTAAEWNPVFERIGRDWMLISASDGERENTMTASWGGIGIVWNQPVAVCLIRPERFTYPIADRAERLSLAFLPDGYRDALKFCGRESGRDHPDKFAAAGLTVAHEGEVPYPAEADTVLICRKLYADDLRAERFLDPGILPACYRDGGLHRVFVCRIEKVLKRG